MNTETTTWYKVNSTWEEITAVEAVKVTEKQITYRQWDDCRKKFYERRSLKMSDYSQFFPTWKQAHEYLLQRTERQIEVIRRQLESYEDKLRNIQRMKQPEA